MATKRGAKKSAKTKPSNKVDTRADSARVAKRSAKAAKRSAKAAKSSAKKPAAKKPAAKKPAAKKPAAKKPAAKKPAASAKKTTQRGPAVAAPTPSSSEHSYVHVGHGISAARKDWYITIVLREPVTPAVRATLAERKLPAAFDTTNTHLGQHAFSIGHGSDSLQWVVAAMYEGAGSRADKGEATDVQWEAFNRDVDAYLETLHQTHPIAVVIRTVDEEYSTSLSEWHAWSCRELPRYLPFLAATLPKSEQWCLAHAIDLWRGWFEDNTLEQQTQIVGAIDDAAKAVFKKHGGAPKATAPKRKSDPLPTLAEMKAVWAAIPRDANAFDAFSAAFSHLWFESGGKVELNNFIGAINEEPSAEHDELLIDVARRALATPGVEWPDTHWRPDLVEALARRGRTEEALREVARVVMAATSYLDGSWVAIIRLLDALGRTEDGTTIFRVADHYVTGFDEPRKGVPRAPSDQHIRASHLLLELTAPARDNLDNLDDELIRHCAFLFADLIKEGEAHDTLLPEITRMRAEVTARQERRLADGHARLARGEPVDETTLKELIQEGQRNAAVANPDEIERLARMSLNYPELIPQLEALAYYTKDSNPRAALAVYRALLRTNPPATDAGSARTSWLQSANAALIVTHAQKLFDESAQLADQVVVYARENPYITHSAACSYAAVQRYDDAVAQVRLAVELGYPHLDKVRTDKDLGPLLEREDFKALFKSAGKKKPKGKN